MTSSMESLVQTAAWLEKTSGRALPAGLGKLAERSQRSYFVFPEKGGLFRELDQIHLHQMPGANDEQFLRSAIALEVAAEIEGAEIVVNTQVSNTGAGHHYPTGSPLRQVLLVVRATYGGSEDLTQVAGDVLPEWTGDVAGLAGQGYAKILRDTLTGEEPTFSHWRLVELAEDSRIPALSSKTWYVPLCLAGRNEPPKAVARSTSTCSSFTAGRFNSFSSGRAGPIRTSSWLPKLSGSPLRPVNSAGA